MLRIFEQKPVKITRQKARRSSARIQKKHNSDSGKNERYPFRSAGIACQEGACEAVRKLEGARFLVRNVPPIPVPDCTSANCKCSYIRYNDRRGLSEDRRAFFNANTQYLINGNEDRRAKEGRRDSDETTWGD